MRGLALVISLVLTIASAAAALLIVAPAPIQKLAFLAIVVDEKSFLVVGAAVVGALFAWASLGPGRWVGAVASLAMAAFAFGVALIPPVQAMLLAKERHVPLDWGRYLRGSIDIAPAKPEQTLPFTSVDGHPLSLDVYRPPAGTPGPVPAVIVIHGGGWSSGDKGETPMNSARLAAQGYAVFDIQYRLLPRPNWKAAVGDVKCAIGWVKQHARDAGVEIDPQRVTLLGRSAGGHLALLAGYAPDDPTLPPSCAAGNTKVESVIAFYAPTDLVWGYAHPSNPRVYDSGDRLRWFLGGAPVNFAEAYEKCSITNNVGRHSPRTLLLHGGRDQFVSLTNLYLLAPKLKAAGVPHDVVVIPYGQHAFDYVVGGLGQQIAEAAVLQFLAAGRRV